MITQPTWPNPYALQRTAAPLRIRAQRPRQPSAVAQRIDSVSAEFARIEREQTNPEVRRAIHCTRRTWLDYVRSRRQADVIFVAQGITFDDDYYEAQHRLLDAQLAQIHSLRTSQ